MAACTASLQQHRFNSATASPPWMTSIRKCLVRPKRWLQFGHSVAAVDDDKLAGGLTQGIVLQFGHSVAAVDDSRQWSVRPCRSTLQFGHSVAAVDDTLPQARLNTKPIGLQFGHSVAAVDDTGRLTPIAPRSDASIRPQRRRRR